MTVRAWIVGTSVLGCALYLWVHFLFLNIYNFHCHVDVAQWVEATQNFSAEQYVKAASRDRPVLLLFLSSLWMKKGFLALDALMLNARFAWVLCMTTFFSWAIRMYNLRAAVLGMIFLFWSHSYAGLVLSVSAQMPFNALVAVHMALGYSLVRSKNPLAWFVLGMLSCLLPLCKEQGFFFPPIALLALVIAGKGIVHRLFRIIMFVLGGAPCLYVLYWWQMLIMTHGRKYQELFSDLKTLHAGDTFSEKSGALLNWGSVDTTFQAPKSYGELIVNAWARLTNEIGVHFLLGVGLAVVCLVLCRFMSRKVDTGVLLWIFAHAIPALPLFVMLLIEPYHLSFLEIPAAGLVVWSCFHLFPNEPWYKREGWPERIISWGGLGGVALGGVLVVALVRGQPFFWAMPWEIGSCMTERLLPVMQYVNRNPSLQKTTYVTDNAVAFAKVLPEYWKLAPTTEELIALHCQEDFLLLYSPTTSGALSLSTILRHKQWNNRQEIRSINSEQWNIYEPSCN